MTTLQKYPHMHVNNGRHLMSSPPVGDAAHRFAFETREGHIDLLSKQMGIETRTCVTGRKRRFFIGMRPETPANATGQA
jgi:hypothetical protein